MLARTMPTSSAAALHRSLKEDKVESKQPKEKTFTSLYATPKEIPLPYSPYSSPPSPYILNHKARRPPLLFKTSSRLPDADAQANATTSLRKSTSLSFPICEATSDDHDIGVPERPVWDSSPPRGDNSVSHISNGRVESSNGFAWESYLLESVRTKAIKERDSEDFYNICQSVSVTSNTEVEDDAGAENSHNFSSSGGEFHDARDELSTDSGTQSSINNIETELSGMRLSLLMEIEKRRQAEDTLEKMQFHWRRLREQLAHVDMFVPLDPTSSHYTMNIADELRCQLEVTRFVSDALGSDLAKAEVRMEMESELEAKNFEITRLSDRLHYYETVNQEMSQRNQEAIEAVRRDGERRKRRERWIWGSIAASMTLGGAVLVWPYLATGISSTDVAQAQSSPVNEAP